MNKKINNYEILSKIASGGMANIYLALDIRTNSKVAIKVLKEEVSDKEKILERFAQEGLLNLNHPNIVKILDAGIHESTPYIVMEYIDGIDLEEFIRQERKLDIQDALDILTQILSALSYVHSKGIIHRDIKPKNILIDKKGRVLLTDFGIAKSLYSHINTSTGGYLGAPAYSSPEQMDGKPVDKRSDIYSLGITLYQMLTGNIPFSSTSIDVIIREKFQSMYVPISRYVPGLPDFIIFIVNKCLSKDPVKRFDSSDDIKAILNKYAGTGVTLLAEKSKKDFDSINLILKDKNFRKYAILSFIFGLISLIIPLIEQINVSVGPVSFDIIKIIKLGFSITAAVIGIKQFKRIKNIRVNIKGDFFVINGMITGIFGIISSIIG